LYLFSENVSASCQTEKHSILFAPQQTATSGPKAAPKLGHTHTHLPLSPRFSLSNAISIFAHYATFCIGAEFRRAAAMMPQEL
jgi:hypothetical protein